MMKKTAFVFLLSLAWSIGFGQTEASIDHLKQQLDKAKDDTSRILKMALICHHYGYQNYDSSIVYARQALALLERNNFPRGKARVFFGLGCTYLLNGDISKAMSILLDGLQLAKKNQCKIEEASCLMAIGFCYQRLNDSKAVEFFQKAKLAGKKSTQREGLEFIVPETEVNLGIALGLNKQLDSAQHYLQTFADTTSTSTWRAVALTALAEVLIRKEEPQMALKCLNESIALDIKNNDDYSTMWASLALSHLYKNLNQSDSCLFYAQKGFIIAQKLGIKEGMMRSSLIMAEQHEKTDLKKSIHYHQIYEGLYKELYGIDKIVALQKILLQEQERQRKVESDQLAYQNRVKQYGFLAIFAMLLSLALILYLNNRQKQKTNALLQSKNQELEIETALERVRALTMDMHKSDELGVAIFSLFGQLKKLGIDPVSSWISLVDVDQNTMEIWTTHGHKNVKPITVRGADFENFEREIEAWGNGQDIVLKTPADLSKVALKNFFNIDLIVPQQVSFFHLLQIRHQFGFMGLGTWEEASIEEQRIVRRFATVFEQTYTRFLDLQKAESLAEQASLDLIKIQTEKNRAEDTLTELRSTQSQLIQSEKLASLGELTAGIAHEIQNPLNFVNNFAEVSAEMLDEMHEELEKGDTTEAIAIATDLKTNLEKINHHGQRASAIVKGMLEHSRASTGVKELTDLNALADEYLRLAYHGLRAKDNRFNATLETHFDPDLPLVSVIPQDIGRVLLNLINNAFYAVHQRAVETLHATSLQHPPYQPTITISTQKTDDQIIIKVKDNGNGIPEAIRDKIFQPFFTTKPTGQGTGLGLSLAYDIVTKGHGGSLEVESTPNTGATFVITFSEHSRI